MNLAFDNLSIAQLRALVTILEVRNLSRAAILLGSSQSALSRHLAQFREAMGDPLLVRQGREYILSERGQLLFAPMKEVLERLEQISSPSVFTPATCERRFSLAGSDYVAQYILPGLLDDLARIAPRACIDFHTWQANRFDWLASGKVDVVTSMLDDTPADYHGRIIGEDSAMCCLRAGHPLAGVHSISQEQFLNWPHVKITAGGDKDGFIEAYLRKLHLRREVRLTVPFYSAAMAVIQHSDALLTLPGHIARKWTERADVRALPLSFIEHHFRYWVVWHSRTQGSPEQQWFRQFVHQHCRSSQFLSPGDRLPHYPA